MSRRRERLLWEKTARGRAGTRSAASRESFRDIFRLADDFSAEGRDKSCVVQDVGAEGLGAVDVNELTPEDWESLPSWGLLKPLQRRRLLESRPASSGGGAF